MITIVFFEVIKALNHKERLGKSLRTKGKSM
jgi:hypothetical protein